ncbi:lysyl oxidase homolog 3 [Trichoplusia ni]|uniref:protein-lysine 6-oxidase n=1 Tax=Trichoplusia ni TaxID=7111 RepID=A0A7E5VNH4_TRINI|nr:lysyl oxidase homolog 3 [Trichoplusia ni]
MVQVKRIVNSIVLVFLLIRTVVVFSRDLSEKDRNSRAKYIQKLINKQKKYEGRIKLSGGPNRYEGNVYIYHAGRWGAVCDDSWDNQAATVVCKKYNKTGIATVGSKYGNATEKFWLDDVICQGDESSLSRCAFKRWGASDCKKDEAAGVKCLNGTNSSNLMRRKTRGKKLHEVLDIRNASMRLVGGRDFREGRVEIYHNGIWGSICPESWSFYEATTVCQHLDLGYAEEALITFKYGFSNIILSGVHCEGNEKSLFQCRHWEFGNVMCKSEKGHVAAVVCTQKLADLILDTTTIERTAHLQDAMMYMLQCAMEENCLSRSAYELKKNTRDWQYETRRLLRFTASSFNGGNAEFRPYLPKHLWQWHMCHMHYHSMEVFAIFDVLDENGVKVAEGHKASFCLEDNTCLPGVDKKYSCKNYGDQGISVNCSDVYMYNIDCQWVDVTDVQPGDYTFKVAVNPHARVAEQSYHNNAATCRLRLTDSYATVYDCQLGRPFI